jgi:DtxR family Mn-dependent transcriptional regulator
VRAGIAAGIVVEVEPLNQGRFVIRWAGLEKKVTPEEAAAISVEPFQEDAARPLPTGNLGALRDGQQGEVFGLSPAIRGLERRRLLDLGFVPGSRVVREGSGFLNGPVRFRVRGTVQAIRPEQSKKIFLK